MQNKCPICGHPAQDKTKPFCSKRCAMIDLGKWLGEEYKVKSEASEDEEVPLQGPKEEE